MLPVHTILHPTDFSECAEFAFKMACSLARDFGARVIVLHVAARPPVLNLGGMAVPPAPGESARRSLEEQLHRVQAANEDVRVEHRLSVGDVVEEVLRVANEVDSGLIVIGTHGRGGLSRLLMGSVAEQIVRKAECPVLSIKMPSAEASTALPATAAASVN